MLPYGWESYVDDEATDPRLNGANGIQLELCEGVLITVLFGNKVFRID